MGSSSILIICLLSLIVSIPCVTVGGISLLTVPLLIAFGMLPKNAVATGMFGVIFFSLSGAIGFRRELGKSQYKMLIPFSLLAILGSFIGANLVLTINEDILKNVIAFMVFIIAVSFFFRKDLGIKERREKIPTINFIISIFSIFILSIYGGFFGGGYITLLSYILILFFGLDFLQVAFITKIFKLLIAISACAFFYYHDLIDFSLGIPLAISMSLGAFLGAKLAIKKGNLWIRNLFVIFAVGLAIKLLFF